MTRKILGLFAALFLTCGLLAAVTMPAQAATIYSTPWNCQNYGGVGYAVTTCVSIEWRVQNDGTGVYLEGEQHWTSNGCGDLEGSGGKYTNYEVNMGNPATGSITHQFNFGDEPCTSYQDIEWSGRDAGGMYVDVFMKARVNLAGDKNLGWGWTIQANGDRSLNYRYVENA